MSQFQVGEVVVLNSGGPDMTVVNPSLKTPMGDLVTCQWSSSPGAPTNYFND